MTSAWDDAPIVGAWAPTNEKDYEAGACGQRCPHSECLGTAADWLGDGSYLVPWECAHGSWLMAADKPAGWTAGPSASHAIALEWDSAATAATCVRWLEHRGCFSFGDISFLEDMRYYAAETPEQRAGRKEAEALREAADVEAVIGVKVARKEEKWTNKGSMKFRVPRPCRYASLFEKRLCAGCSAPVPEGQTSCSAIVVKVEEQERRRDGRMAGTGKMVSRLAKAGDVGARPCGETLAGCWNHEQHHTCIYVHPDEPQWAAACAGTLRVKEDNRLVFCMAGEERSAASASLAASRDFTGRFNALMAAPHHGGHKHGQQQSAPLSAKWGQQQRGMISRAAPPPVPAPSKKPWTMLADGSIQYQAGAWAAAGGGGGSAAAGGGSKQADRAWARAQGSTDGYGKPASQEQRGWYH